MPTVPDVNISRRRTLYACCAGAAGRKAIQYYQRGDMECFRKYLKQAKYMLWAKSVMDRTAMSTEDPGDKCVTHDMACAVIGKADPFCVGCGCKDPNPPTGPVPPSLPPCTLVADYTLGFNWGELGFEQCGFDVGLLGGVVFDSSLEFFGGSGVFLATESYTLTFPVMEIVSGGVYSVNALGEVTLLGILQPDEIAFNADYVCDGSPGWWQSGVSAPWPLFPTLTAQVNADNTVTLGSAYASEQQYGLRQVLIEYTTNGLDWIWLGGVSYPESAIAAGLTTLPNPAYANIQDIRATYINGDCNYGPYPVSWSFTAQDIELLLGTSKEADGNLHIYSGNIPGDPQPFTPPDQIANTSSFADIVLHIKRVDNTYLVAGCNGTAAFIYSQNNGASWVPSGGVASASTDYVQFISPAFDNLHVFGIRTLNSLWRSANRGLSYSEVDITPITDVDQPTCVVGYNDQQIIVGARDNIWRSMDGGTTWAVVQAGMNGVSNMLILTGSIFQTAGTILAWDRDGVWRSTNKGLNWTFLGAFGADTFDADFSGMVVYTNTGWKSTDLGVSWFPITLEESGTAFSALRVKAITTQEVLMTTFQKVMRTLNGGQTWTEIYDHDSVGVENTFSLEYNLI